MTRHRHACSMWKTCTIEGQQDEPKIPLRHVHPLVSEINISQDDLDEETESESDVDPAKRIAFIEEEVTILKVMTS